MRCKNVKVWPGILLQMFLHRWSFSVKFAIFFRTAFFIEHFPTTTSEVQKHSDALSSLEFFGQ